ncbi:E3 ubiquitin-protein ligase RNF166 isoform X1 [Bubalus bubalis]|uniref:E3 ubiquitin-protein ligase RNF166 isoform X1 n=2 Tax=Bubalus bubalis TaxID=89462 RepID=UPI001D0F75AB|nr:E3 ubiquitin-protein ligase RNF166 isoform X1 [Bubalus bubalis]
MAMFRSLVGSAQQRQPPGGPAGGDSALEAQYSCPICLEVYHRPVAIGSCGHTFCGECLQPCLQVPSPLCPLCRLPFDPKKVDKAAHVEKQLASYKAPCRGCSKKVTLAKMRVHVSSCVKVQEQMANCPKFVPVVPTSQPIPSAVPNRSTFACPYCGARNLDQQELVKHCVDNHRSDPNRVVSCLRPGPCSPHAWPPRPRGLTPTPGSVPGLQHRRGGRLPGRPGPVSLRELTVPPPAEPSHLQGQSPPAPAPRPAWEGASRAGQNRIAARGEATSPPPALLLSAAGSSVLGLSTWPRGVASAAPVRVSKPCCPPCREDPSGPATQQGHAGAQPSTWQRFPLARSVLAFVIPRGSALFYIIRCDDLFMFSRAKTEQLPFILQYLCLTRNNSIFMEHLQNYIF